MPFNISQTWRRGKIAHTNACAWQPTMNTYWRLIRPGILVAVVFSMAIGALTASEPPPRDRLLHALLATSLLIAGASAMNQLIERQRDAIMARTASRPLPSGQTTSWHVAVVALTASLAGIGFLAASQRWLMTLLAGLSWCIYVLIYTPLKRRSVWQTPVGAVAGALPVLLGAATAATPFSLESWAIFGILFFWQFSHTAAIGWLYRNQYADGAVKVAAVVDPSGRLSGRLALFGAAGMLAASLAPPLLSTAGWPYATVALSLGTVHFTIAAKFSRSVSDADARMLWRVSLIHLPAVLAMLLAR